MNATPSLSLHSKFTTHPIPLKYPHTLGIPVTHPTTPTSSPIPDSLTCASCGYFLRTLAPDANCPECGTPISQSLQPRGAARFGTRWHTCFRFALIFWALTLFPLAAQFADWSVYHAIREHQTPQTHYHPNLSWLMYTINGILKYIALLALVLCFLLPHLADKRRTLSTAVLHTLRVSVFCILLYLLFHVAIWTFGGLGAVGEFLRIYPLAYSLFSAICVGYAVLFLSLPHILDIKVCAKTILFFLASLGAAVFLAVVDILGALDQYGLFNHDDLGCIILFICHLWLLIVAVYAIIKSSATPFRHAAHDHAFPTFHSLMRFDARWLACLCAALLFWAVNLLIFLGLRLSSFPKFQDLISQWMLCNRTLRWLGAFGVLWMLTTLDPAARPSAMHTLKRWTIRLAAFVPVVYECAREYVLYSGNITALIAFDRKFFAFDVLRYFGLFVYLALPLALARKLQINLTLRSAVLWGTLSILIILPILYRASESLERLLQPGVFLPANFKPYPVLDMISSVTSMLLAGYVLVEASLALAQKRRAHLDTLA